jgi:NitT/TauT family transport system substrate-binding protein
VPLFRRQLYPVVAGLVIAAVAVGCGGGGGSSGGASSGAGLQFGYDGVKQLSYANSLLAWDQMKSPAVKPHFFQQSSLNLQALSGGNVQISQNASAVTLPAIAKGADLRIIGATVLHSWVLMTSSDIKSLADLKGKKLAAHSETSVSALFARQVCKTAGCDIVYIPGSPVRAQAILSGQVAAATVFAADAIRAANENPGKTHVLQYFQDAPLPDLYVVTTKKWLDGHRQQATAVMRGLLDTAHGMKQDTRAAAASVQKQFPDEDPKLVAEVVKTYTDKGLWSQDGGLEMLKTVGDSVKFLKSVGAIPQNASDNAADYVDTGPLEAAMNAS